MTNSAYIGNMIRRPQFRYTKELAKIECDGKAGNLICYKHETGVLMKMTFDGKGWYSTYDMINYF
jgi:hypothetical protein